MSKAKFIAARELINEKQYDQARSILKTINHPTATEWLRKLDEIAPAEQSTTSKASWLRNLDKTSTTQVPSKNGRGRNRLTIGIAATMSIIVITVVLIILIPKTLNQNGSVPNQQLNQPLQTESTEIDASQSKQIEALVIYCMKQADLSRDECTSFAKNVVNDSEFSPTIANCTENYAGNLDAFTVCMKDIEKKLNQRRYDEIFQPIFLYQYCTGELLSMNQQASFYENTSVDAYNQPCKEWALKLADLHPSMRTSRECLGSTTLYDLIGSGDLNESTRIVNCMAKNLGDSFPPKPSI